MKLLVVIVNYKTADLALRAVASALPDVGALGGRITAAGGREVAGLALEPSSTATSIRGGIITDGPFIESKEAILGVFVIEARDLDHAIELAAMTPIVDGGVEVRPLVDFQVVPEDDA